MTFQQAEEEFNKRLSVVSEDTPFNCALIRYQEEVRRLQEENQKLKADRDDLRYCLDKAEQSERYYQRQCQVLARHIK